MVDMPGHAENYFAGVATEAMADQVGEEVCSWACLEAKILRATLA